MTKRDFRRSEWTTKCDPSLMNQRRGDNGRPSALIRGQHARAFIVLLQRLQRDYSTVKEMLEAIQLRNEAFYKLHSKHEIRASEAKRILDAYNALPK